MKGSSKVEPAGSGQKRKSNPTTVTTDPAGSSASSKGRSASEPPAPSGKPATGAMAAASNSRKTAKTTAGGSAEPATQNTSTSSSTISNAHKAPVPESDNVSMSTRMTHLEQMFIQSREESKQMKTMIQALCANQTQTDANSASRYTESQADEGMAMAYEHGEYSEYDSEYGYSVSGRDEGMDYEYDYVNTGSGSAELGQQSAPLDSTGNQRSKDEHTVVSDTVGPGQPDISSGEIGFASRYATMAEISEPLGSDIANSVDFLLTNPLEEKHIAETCQKYMRPQDCANLLVPRVNPLIWDNLYPKVRVLDMKIQKCQKPLVKGMTALMRSLKDTPELNEIQQDAVALLANAPV